MLAAGDPLARLAVEVPHPDADRVAGREAHRPGVPVAVGGPRLPGHPRHVAGEVPRLGQVRPADVGEDLRHRPRRLRREEGDGIGLRVELRVSLRYSLNCNGPVLPPLGQGGVEIDQVEQPDLPRAEDQRQPVPPRRPVERREPAALEEAEEVAQPRLRQQADGGGVERGDQRLPHRHPPPVALVVVLRHVAGEVGGDVEDVRVRHQPPLVHGHGVEERLEGRSRRPAGDRAVHLPLEVGVAVAGRPHQRPHPARLVVDHHHGRVADPLVPQLLGPPGHLGLRDRLHRPVEGGPDARLARGSGPPPSP